MGSFNQHQLSQGNGYSHAGVAPAGSSAHSYFNFSPAMGHSVSLLLQWQRQIE